MECKLLVNCLVSLDYNFGFPETRISQSGGSYRKSKRVMILEGLTCTDEKISGQLIHFKTCCPIFIRSRSHAIAVKTKNYKLKRRLNGTKSYCRLW